MMTGGCAIIIFCSFNSALLSPRFGMSLPFGLNGKVAR
jgi:hypothetical protein